MANPSCRTCGRSAVAGAYCNSCATGIVAKAFNPFYGSRREKLPLGQRALFTATRARGRQRIRSTTAVPVAPALALQGVTI